MSRETFEILRLVSSTCVIVPLILVLTQRSKWSSIQRRLFWLLLGMFLCELISNIFWYQKMNNFPIYHLYTIAEFTLILNIYKEILAKYITKGAVLGLGAAFVTFAIYNTLYIQSIFTFNSNTVVVLSVLVIGITMVFFYDLLNLHHYTSLSSNNLFWISAGLLIYFASNLVLFYINNLLNLSRSESYTIWGLHAIIHILLILFFTRAVWTQPEKE